VGCFVIAVIFFAVFQYWSRQDELNKKPWSIVAMLAGFLLPVVPNVTAARYIRNNHPLAVCCCAKSAGASSKRMAIFVVTQIISLALALALAESSLDLSCSMNKSRD